jgi:hypothetical protein
MLRERAGRRTVRGEQVKSPPGIEDVHELTGRKKSAGTHDPELDQNTNLGFFCEKDKR